MRIGPPHWQWVSIDSVGVPRGGRYGRPKAIAKKLARHGIYLAWSQLWECFDVYTKVGPERIVHQFRCRRGDDTPIPLTDEFAELLIALQADCPTGEQMAKRLVKIQQEKRMELAYERAKEQEAMKDDVMRAVDLTLGLDTRKPQIIVPGGN